MTRILVLAVVGLAMCLPGSLVRAEYPKPSIYPKSWELKFEHGLPKRIVVEVPGERLPKAFWYMTYSVTNPTEKDIAFLPAFEMVTRKGDVVRSDRNIPLVVFEAIRRAEGNKLLENTLKISGEVRPGVDQARDGVAIWSESMAEMGSFSVFIAGLCGESASVKNDKGEELRLFKTLQLNYLIRGDDVYPGEDEVNENAEAWVMR